MRALRACFSARLFALLLLMPAMAAARSAPPPEPGWTHAVWTVRDGLPVHSFSGITQSRDGYLWIATFDGLVRFDGAQFTVLDAANTAGITSSRFAGVVADPGGGVWVLSEVDGLLHTDGTGLRPVRDKGAPVRVQLGAVVADKPGELIGAFDSRIFRVVGDRVEHYSPNVSIAGISSPSRDRSGVVHWTTPTSELALEGDRLIAKPLTNASVPSERAMRGAATVANANSVRARTPDGAFWSAQDRMILRDGRPVLDAGAQVIALYADREGTLWATASNGLHRIARATVSMVAANVDGEPFMVNAMREARDGGIWMVGTQGTVARWGADGLRTVNTRRVLTAIDQSDTDEMWIATFGGPGFIDPQFHVRYRLDPNGPVYEMVMLARDPSGVVWTSSRDTLRAYEAGKWRVVFPAPAMPRTSLRSMLTRRDGSQWFGSAGRGIVIVRGARIDTLGTAEGMPALRVRGLYEDERGVVWAATEGGGLARIELAASAEPAKARITTIRKRDGLLDETLHAIVEDDTHRMWISTNRGVFCVAREQLDAFASGKRQTVAIRAFSEAQGMATAECNGTSQPAALRASDGTLWFATQSGAAVIDPRRVPLDIAPREVTVDAVHSRNERVSLASGRVRLLPSQREFSIGYSSAEFLAPQQMRFRYRLRDRGADWVEAGDRRVAYFSNVSPGRHLFEVQASSGGPWSESTTLPIDVVPRWYETLVFRVAALLALVGGAYVAYRRRLSELEARERELSSQVAARTADLVREKQETELARANAEAERAAALTARAEAESARREAEGARDVAQRSLETIEKQAEELRQLDAAKSRFFANISHEFRTPLTLTIGPLEDLLGGYYGKLEDVAHEPVELALRNANRALSQVNRILDLARLEAGGMNLQARESDLQRDMNELVALFAPLAVRRSVRLTHAFEAAGGLWYDRGLLEQAVANLLSNALKFTPAGRAVQVSGVRTGEGDRARYAIVVRDEGPGIAPEEQPRLFERFYQAAGARDMTRPGTGIGLALARDIVEMHGGSITLESALGQGSTFTVLLPFGDAHLREDQRAAVGAAPARPALSAQALAEVAPVAEEPDEEVSIEIASDSDTETVLVIEDDPEVRRYLQQHLEARYRVVVASDGAAGLRRARRMPPDLVICDVMMPVMDGFGFLREMQADADLAGTPVVMLTARTAFEDRIEGLELGAIEYLAKPFHAPELLLRVRNLLAAQRRLRERLRVRELHAAKVEVSSEDDRFLARLRSAIETHLGEEDFDVEKLAHVVGLSRAHLYRRVKELLDETPELLLRRMRLERAKQLLADKAGNVGEVAYATGFKTVAWFCRIFRETYGVTPGQWARSGRGPEA